MSVTLLHHWSDDYPGIPLYLPLGSTAIIDDNEECVSVFIKVADNAESRRELAEALEVCATKLRDLPSLGRGHAGEAKPPPVKRTE